MSDICDDADKTQELFMQLAQRNRPRNGPPPMGYCHYCGEAVEGDRRFCDGDCRDGWELEQRLKG